MTHGFKHLRNKPNNVLHQNWYCHLIVLWEKSTNTEQTVKNAAFGTQQTEDKYLPCQFLTQPIKRFDGSWTKTDIITSHENCLSKLMITVNFIFIWTR